MRKNKKYSTKLKIAAVKSYLAGEGSNGVLGYRQMCINMNREKIDELPRRINVKRVRRIMQILGIKSVIRRKHPDYVKSTPEITLELPNF